MILNHSSWVYRTHKKIFDSRRVALSSCRTCYIKLFWTSCITQAYNFLENHGLWLVVELFWNVKFLIHDLFGSFCSKAEYFADYVKLSKICIFGGTCGHLTTSNGAHFSLAFFLSSFYISKCNIFSFHSIFLIEEYCSTNTKENQITLIFFLPIY